MIPGPNVTFESDLYPAFHFQLSPVVSAIFDIIPTFASRNFGVVAFTRHHPVETRINTAGRVDELIRRRFRGPDLHLAL
jgi:hypothetical protein